MDIQALKGQYKQKLDAAKAISDKWAGREGEMLSGDLKQMQDLLGASDVLKAQIDATSQLNAGMEYANATATPAAFRQAAPGEGVVAVDEKSHREIDLGHGRTIKYFVPIVTSKVGYASAFEAYARYGIEGVKSRFPNDFKTLIEGTDSAGGYLVPPDFQAMLIKKMAIIPAVRQLANVITTGRDQVQFPKVTYTADDKYTSPSRLTWTGETTTSTAHRVTDPVFGVTTIPICTAMASIPVSNDLAEDAAFNLEDYISQLLSEAFLLGEDDAFINGTGVGRPRGLITAATAGDISYVASGTSAAISTGADAHNGKRIVDLYYALPSQYRAMASWLINSNTMRDIENLVDGQKRPIITALLNASLAEGDPSVIKGKRVVADEFMPDIAANAFPILFGDFKGYTIVDRVAISIQRLDQVYAEQNMVAFLARKRVGGDVVQPWRFRAMKASAS